MLIYILVAVGNIVYIVDTNTLITMSVIDFDIDEELIPKGCGQLDEKWCNNWSQPGCSEGKVD